MIKRSSFIMSMALFAGLTLTLCGQESFLKIEASVVPRKLAQGEEGAVLLKLSLEEGITISPHPDFIIEFEPCPGLVFPKSFFTASDLGIEALEKDGEDYLDVQAPIRIPFTVGLEAKKGSHILEGRIKYFACSKKEGWCVKNSTKFYVTFATRTAVAKKKAEK